MIQHTDNVQFIGKGTPEMKSQKSGEPEEGDMMPFAAQLSLLNILGIHAESGMNLCEDNAGGMTVVGQVQPFACVRNTQGENMLGNVNEKTEQKGEEKNVSGENAINSDGKGREHKESLMDAILSSISDQDGKRADTKNPATRNAMIHEFVYPGSEDGAEGETAASGEKMKSSLRGTEMTGIIPKEQAVNGGESIKDEMKPQESKQDGTVFFPHEGGKIETKADQPVTRGEQPAPSLNQTKADTPSLQAATEQKIQMSVTPYGAGRVDIEVSLHKGEMNAKIVTDGVLGTTDMHKQASHLVHEIMGDSTGIHNMSLMFHDGRSGYFFKKQKNIPFSGDTGNEPPAEVSNVQRSAGIHRVSIIA